ncbi:MAG: diguanylate cyclase [Actinomycetota bacterium]
MIAFLDASHVAITVISPDGIVEEWLGAAESMFGYTSEEMVGRHIRTLWIDEAAGRDLAALERLRAGERVDVNTRRRGKDGRVLDVEISASAIFDADGTWTSTVTMTRDVTPPSLGALPVGRALQDSRLAVIAIDARRRITTWGGGAEALYGWSEPEVLGLAIETLWPVERTDDYERVFQTTAAGASITFRAERRRKDGSQFLAELTVSPGNHGGSVSVSRDVTEQAAIEARAAAAERRFEAAFATAALPLVICELDGTIVEHNDAYGVLTTRSENPTTERLLDLIEPDHRPPIAAALTALAKNPGRFEGIEVPLAGSDNHIVNLSIAPVDDGPDRPPLALVQLIDVSDQLRIQAELAEIATVDPLTQVFNRSCFEPLLASLDAGQPVGLLFVDLDGFKAVNDDRGHAAGDIVLQVVAQRLESVVRDSDYVIRFGGDEFVIVCPGLVERDAAARLGDRLRSVVNQPIDVDGLELAITVSIGAALVHASPELDTDAAIGLADAAMYEAKAAGRDTTVTAPLP